MRAEWYRLASPELRLRSRSGFTEGPRSGHRLGGEIRTPYVDERPLPATSKWGHWWGHRESRQFFYTVTSAGCVGSAVATRPTNFNDLRRIWFEVLYTSTRSSAPYTCRWFKSCRSPTKTRCYEHLSWRLFSLVSTPDNWSIGRKVAAISAFLRCACAIRGVAGDRGGLALEDAGRSEEIPP